MEHGKESRMEKLELLSTTAVLKQGIDGTDDKLHRTSPPIVSQTGHVFPFAPTAVTAPASGGNVDNRTRTTSPSNFSCTTASISTTVIVDSHLASPISSDGEDDENREVAAPARNAVISVRNGHNLQSACTKAPVMESRSPISTVEYRHKDAPPSSPFRSSPQPSYSLPFLPRQQQQQEYQPFYNQHHQGNIIRTLSEASFAPLYGCNSINNCHITSERKNIVRPPQHQLPPPSYEDMVRQIQDMQEQLHKKDILVSSLQSRINYLENQIYELRQLPTGKISHIPVE